MVAEAGFFTSAVTATGLTAAGVGLATAGVGLLLVAAVGAAVQYKKSRAADQLKKKAADKHITLAFANSYELLEQLAKRSGEVKKLYEAQHLMIQSRCVLEAR